jgi:ectoine hydroxylase-related dioxygenase (phytanoyl-CoA dioxygenase family)
VSNVRVTLVRGAATARTAAEWLAAIDAHPSWRARHDQGDGAFNPYSSSIRARTLRSLAPEAVAATLLHGELREFCVALLGDALACNVDQCWVRRQYAPSRYPPRHAPHAWHQDGALGFDFLHPTRPQSDIDLLDMVTCWIALTPCGVDAPGLEWVADDIVGLLQPGDLRDEAVRARHAPAAFRHAVMQPGDCLAFAGNVLHHTQVSAAMRHDRTSLELRFFDAHRLPRRLGGDRFVAMAQEPEGISQ